MCKYVYTMYVCTYEISAHRCAMSLESYNSNRIID